MSDTNLLEQFVEEIYCCTRCGTCKLIYQDYQDSCPAGKKFRFESFYPSGRIHLARGIHEGKLEWTERVRDIIFACPTCASCTVQCQSRHHDAIVDIIEALRAEAVKKGIGPLPSQKAFAESVKKEHNPYKEKHVERLSWKEGMQDEVPEKKEAEVFYFVGCTSSYRQQELARNTVKLLSKLNVDFMVSKEEWCCGSPLMRTGQLDQVGELVKHNLDLIKKSGAKIVISSCAGCYRTLKMDYPKYTELPEDVEILHVTEFLQDMIKNKRVKFKKKYKDLEVTYHDPCHLGRHSGVYEAPRSLINAIPGVKLVEMPRARENSWCCGAGGGVKSAYKEWAVEIASERIEEAENTGCNVLLSACPFCMTNLQDAIKASNSEMEFKDIVELMN
ncbi:MAG: (Fe-S)-binding protein, partial [Candidatus Helarchaeales archaeon]